MIARILRFLVVSLACYALARALPAAVLLGPAWIGWLGATALGVAPLGPPALAGALITYAHGGSPIALEDPYLVAGIPLFLGLWASSPRRSLARGALGVLGLEVFGGITVALVALCVARGWTESAAREPLELVALALVATIRILPVPLWMALDPSWRPRRAAS